MNTANIIIYLFLSGFITFYVGKVLFQNGRHFLLGMLHEEALTDSVNKLLLTGYYLLNFGYVSITLTLGKPATTVSEMIASSSLSVGRIVLTLGIMHFVNIAGAVLWNRFSSNSKH